MPVWFTCTGKGPVRSTAAETFVISALAKLGATLTTYPLQVVKSRLQNVSKHSASDRNYTGTGDAIVRIYQTEGEFLHVHYAMLCCKSTDLFCSYDLS